MYIKSVCNTRIPCWDSQTKKKEGVASQQASVAPKRPMACENQPPRASVSGRVDQVWYGMVWYTTKAYAAPTTQGPKPDSRASTGSTNKKQKTNGCATVDSDCDYVWL